MENNENVNSEENVKNQEVNVDGSGVGTQANSNKDEDNTEKDVKTYTQEEVNSLLKKEKEKYQKKIPSKERLEALKKYEESQKTAEQKNAEKETAYQKALSELKDKENYISVLESGVNKDYSDYVLFKVSRMKGDFEENLDEFLKENPKFLKSEKKEVQNKTTGTSVQTINNGSTSGVDAILKQKHPDLFK